MSNQDKKIERKDKYQKSNRTLHWLGALFILIVVFIPILKDFFEVSREIGKNMMKAHVILGVLVAIITVYRIYLHLKNRKVNPKTNILGHLTHITLYVMTIGLAATGLIAGIGYGFMEFIFSDVPFPGRNIYMGIHHTIGDFFLPLIGLHVAAAIFHQYVLKDGTLKKMMPEKK